MARQSTVLLVAGNLTVLVACSTKGGPSLDTRASGAGGSTAGSSGNPSTTGTSAGAAGQGAAGGMAGVADSGAAGAMSTAGTGAGASAGMLSIGAGPGAGGAADAGGQSSAAASGMVGQTCGVVLPDGSAGAPAACKLGIQPDPSSLFVDPGCTNGCGSGQVCCALQCFPHACEAFSSFTSKCGNPQKATACMQAVICVDPGTCPPGGVVPLSDGGM